MAYIFLLDGVEFDSPVNDQDLVTTIRRGANLDGFLVTQDAEFMFTGDAYVYLSDKFYNDGFCSEVEVEILEDCDGFVTEVYKGIIKMSSIKIDEDTCTIKSKVQDNSFYSYVNNNKSYDVSPTQTGTKTGIEITPPTIYEITVFDPDNGNISPDTVKAYRVYDLIDHAITVMTDGKVGFTSDYLWNQDEELFLTTGNALAIAGNYPSFTYSFDKLYSELNKLFNLSFFIEQDDYSIPTIRIEPKDYFYSTSEGIAFEDLKGLDISVAQEKIYGTVTLGSKKISDAQGQFLFNENTPFYGFKEEKFYPIGQCNLDTELNLVNDYILSSNIIEDCVTEVSPNYYDDLIFVSCGNLDVNNYTADAILYELGGTAPPYLYNLNLNNYNKAQRYFNFLPGNLLDAFNVSSNNFRAEKQTDEVYNAGFGGSASDTQLPLIGSGSTANYSYYDYLLSIEPYDFPDESSPGNYDLGGNYNNATYEYTIPSDGRYTFTAQIFYDLVRTFSNNQQGGFQVRDLRISIRRYNSLSVFQEENETINTIPYVLGTYEANGSASFDAFAGDIIRVKVTIYVRLWEDLILFPTSGRVKFGLKIKGASFFESNSDNVIVGASQVNYKIIKYEFQLPVSKADFNTLLADPTGLQTFTKWSEALQQFRTRRAWLEEIKYNNWTGLASIKLIANNAIIQE